MRPETIPLLLVALLLLSVQPGVESFTTVVDGSERLETDTDAVLLADGNLTLPAGERENATLYVLDGRARIDGALEGRVVQLAGHVDVGSSGTVTGTYRALGGTRTVADGAAVTVDEVAEPLTRERSLAEAVGVFVLQATLIGLLAFVAGRRFDPLFGNVAHSIRRHPVVSATVGLLVSVTLLALFVFMAFTIILLPVSLLGLAGGVVVYLFALLSLGSLVGRRLPFERPGLATAAGTVAVLAAIELLEQVPLVGGLLSVTVLLVTVGAVFLTYFGLREFHPPALAPVE